MAFLIRRFRSARNHKKSMPPNAGRSPSSEGNAKGQAWLDKLPTEILLHILSFLRTEDLAQLLVVSRSLRYLVEDSAIWKLRCYRKSLFYKQEFNVKAGANLELLGPAAPGEVSLLRKWDLSDPKELIDWRKEYEGRHTIKDFDWSCPVGGTLGVSLYQDSQKRLVVAPYASRAVLYWDIDNHQNQLNLRLRRQTTPSTYPIAYRFQLDSSSKSFFLATGHYVQQCDLETSEVINCARFPQRISALSSIEPRLPITVGTLSNLYLWDPRVRHWADEEEHLSQVEDSETASDISAPASAFYESKNRYAMPSALLPDRDPLTILTAPETFGYNVFVSGRFSAILDYDRRQFPSLHSYTHAGMNICDMTLSNVHRGDSLQISACGDSKGSSAEANFVYEPSTGRFRTMQKVRRSMGSTRELSIVPRGQHLLTSDLGGYVNFLERDTLAPLRYIPSQFPDTVIRRMIVADPGCSNSDVVLWDGDKVGVMRTGRSARIREAYNKEALKAARKFTPSSFDTKVQLAWNYEERMRKLLERHADEMNLMRLYGL